MFGTLLLLSIVKTGKRMHWPALSRLLNSNTKGDEMMPFKLRDSDKQSRQEEEVGR